MRTKSRVTILAAAISLVAVAAGGAEYEVPQDRSAKEIVPAAMLKGPNYRVRDVVPTDGYTDRWTVDSDFGVFEVVGDGALRKLIPEIQAIAELKKFSKTEAFAKGLGGATKAPFSFVKSLVTHPVDTTTGVPKGMYQVVENVGSSVSNSKNPAEDSRAAQLLKMSSYKRDLGNTLNVDVYSSNKVLQKELNSVAWAMSVGDMAFSVAMLPAGAGGSIVSNVRLVNSVKNVLKDEPPQRLRIVNDASLEKMGLAAELRDKFLDHTAFTPRHMTIICSNLAAMDGVAGRDAFITVALGAQDETDANMYTTMIQLLRGYHQTVSALAAITPLNRITLARTAGGQGVIALPVDRLPWTDRVDQVTGAIKDKTDLWVTGAVSAPARQELTARGFTITEHAHTRVEVID